MDRRLAQQADTWRRRRAIHSIIHKRRRIKSFSFPSSGFCAHTFVGDGAGPSVLIWGVVVKAKVAGAPRRVWRMTAENRLGEILELAPAPGPGHRGARAQDARASAGAPVASLSSPSSPTSSASNGAASSCTPRALKSDPAPVSSWRASSYDLLHGLRVHDVTDTIPARMFDALFSPDPRARPPSTRKRS